MTFYYSARFDLQVGKFGGICNALFTQDSCAYDSAHLLKSYVSVQKTKILHFTVDTTQHISFFAYSRSLRTKKEEDYMCIAQKLHKLGV